MRAAATIGLLLGAATLAAACSFVTSFPDIEIVGGSGGGADVPCVAAACQNCLTAAGSCPLPGEPLRLIAPVSEPGAGPATAVEIIDIVQKSGGPRYFGNYLDSGSQGLEATDGKLSAGDHSIGFFVGADGARIGGAAACTDDNLPAQQDVFFTGATASNDELVVSGVFIGGKLVVFPSQMDCAGTAVVQAPAAAPGDFVPFLIWFRADSDEVARSLEPVDSETTGDNGYFTDVAAFPGGDTDGRVVALGVAARNPFVGDDPFEAFFRYYILVSNGVASPTLLTLDKGACGDVYNLDARRSSIAVDSTDRIWAAGTGCPLNNTGVDQSFITRVDWSEPDQATTLTMDEPDSAIGITEIAVSDAIVAVAGTYSGKPIAALENGDAIPTGQDGDGFVMAFTRDGWGNQSKPIWFQRLASQGFDARIETLAIDGGRVFIGGRMGATGGIGEAEGCWASPAPGRGRGFFAQLSEASGALDWLRVEGFEAAETEGIAKLSVRGMALSPVNGGLLTATGFHGELLLECGPDATNDTGNPEVLLRLFDLQ